MEIDLDYSDFHRKFLRTISARGCVQLSAAQRHFAELKQSFPEESGLDMDAVIQHINREIAPFEKQVTVMKHEHFKEDFVVFSTLAPLPILMPQQKVMRPNDFIYFEAVLRAVLEADQYELRYSVALTTEAAASSSSTTKRRSLASDNEKLLQMWIKLGYFALKDGWIYLGAKSLVEFKSYIQTEYPNINVCELCLNVTFMDNDCQSCNKYFHLNCIEKYWANVPNNPSCPSCKSSWQQDTQLERRRLRIESSTDDE